MFKYLYTYYYNVTDTPSIQYKLNVWAFSNIRLNKIKVTQNITYFISNLLSLQQKYIKIFHKNFNFDSFYFSSIILTLLVSLIFFIF